MARSNDVVYLIRRVKDDHRGNAGSYLGVAFSSMQYAVNFVVEEMESDSSGYEYVTAKIDDGVFH